MKNEYWFSSGQSGQGGGDPGDPIFNSLRFRGNQLLECNTFSDSSGSGEGTISLWVKLGKDAAKVYPIHGGSNAGGSNLASDFGFTTSVPNITISNPPELVFINSEGGAFTSYMSDPRFSARDPSAWYHIVMQWRRGVSLLCWINGVPTPLQQPNWASQAHEQNWGYMRHNAPTKIGVYGIGETNKVQGMYLAQVYGCHQQFYTAEDFGRFNDAGVWVPVNFTGDYGSNGFHLDFSDPTNIGEDSSGNNNHFTDSGFELGDSTNFEFDNMFDSPTQNWSVLNPIQTLNAGKVFQGLDRANLVTTGYNSSDLPTSFSTIKIEAGQRYYVEWQTVPGAGTTNVGVSYRRLENAAMGQWKKDGALNYFCDHRDQFTFDNTSPANNSPGNYINGGVASFEIDATVNPFTVTARFNGGNAMTQSLDGGATAYDADEVYFFVNSQYSTAGHLAVNFGQQPFQFQPNGTVPLQTQNLPEAPIANGRDHFQAITDTGANILTTAQTAFPNGLWWIRQRSGNGFQHQLVDNVMFPGNNSAITCPNSAPVTAGNYAAPANESIAWCWNASDPATNGFNIIKSDLAGAGAVAHGLPGRPAFMIFRQYSIQDNIYTWHKEYEFNGSGYQYQVLATSAGVTYGGSDLVTGVDETNITFGGAVTLPQIIYAWSEIPGYSAFGSYNGTGSANNAFVYTGFRPAFVMIKSIPGGAGWNVYDTTRDVTNPTSLFLSPSNTVGETTGFNIDILSNGFKIRSGNGPNGSSTGAIYVCFAENPFGGSNTVPATAR